MNVTKIILTRCQIFHLKCTKFNFRLGLSPRPRCVSSQNSPDLLAGVGEEGRERRKGGRGKGAWEMGRERVREKEEGKGHGRVERAPKNTHIHGTV